MRSIVELVGRGDLGRSPAIIFMIVLGIMVTVRVEAKGNLFLFLSKFSIYLF